jgi:hypothetical protein
MRRRLAQQGFGADHGPVQTLNGRLMRTRIRQAATAPRQ